MDPDANLEELRRLIARANTRSDKGLDVDPVDAMRIVALIDALDGWISKGGFLPKDWRK